jgi:nicotinamidase-related amidase
VTRAASLHGNALDRHPIALLLVDVMNDLEFPEGGRLLPAALQMARRLARLADRCRRASIPVIYANDNFGRWRSDFRSQVKHCLEDGVRGEAVVRILAPDAEDYFVLKAKNSAFHDTVLEALLMHLRTRRLIVGGLTTDNCVLFTAMDAYLRELEIFVPRDCVATANGTLGRQALAIMSHILKADTRESRRVSLGAGSGSSRHPER